MRLEKLPKNVIQQIGLLFLDQQFQQRCKNDEVLNKLEDQKYNPQIQFFQLQLILNKKMRLYGIDFNPLTVALLSYLYSIQSPIIKKTTDMTIIDLNVFFYLLQTKDYNTDLSLVLQNSMNYCERVLHIDLEQALNAFNKIYKVQLRVLSMFQNKNNLDESIFNLDWAICLISNMKNYVSYTTQQLYTDVSIMQIFYYYANYCRNTGIQAIFLKPEQQILFEEDKRGCQLIMEKLVEKNVVTKEDANKYLELMITKSQENK